MITLRDFADLLTIDTDGLAASRVVVGDNTACIRLPDAVAADSAHRYSPVTGIDVCADDKGRGCLYIHVPDPDDVRAACGPDMRGAMLSDLSKAFCSAADELTDMDPRYDSINYNRIVDTMCRIADTYNRMADMMYLPPYPVPWTAERKGEDDD